MATQTLPLSDFIVHLFALASRLEGEGQYNLAKLARAGADTLCRKSAYHLHIPSDKVKLVSEIEKAIQNLALLNADAHLLQAFQKGLAAMQSERLPLIDETPDPFVCRTCGRLSLAEVTENCPTCSAWSSTYQRFPPVYWLDAFDPPNALENLRQTPREVAALLEGLSEDSMAQQPPEAGWAMRNVISHLRDAQVLFDFRLDLFLHEEQPRLESQAVFAWATDERDRPATTTAIFAAYQDSRQKSLEMLESIPLVDWWRTGWHEEFGKVTIKQQASYFASHELTHLPQLEKLRAQLTGKRQAE
jgi:hypothetical protein